MCMERKLSWHSLFYWYWFISCFSKVQWGSSPLIVAKGKRLLMKRGMRRMQVTGINLLLLRARNWSKSWMNLESLVGPPAFLSITILFSSVAFWKVSDTNKFLSFTFIMSFPSFLCITRDSGAANILSHVNINISCFIKYTKWLFKYRWRYGICSVEKACLGGSSCTIYWTGLRTCYFWQAWWCEWSLWDLWNEDMSENWNLSNTHFWKVSSSLTQRSVICCADGVNCSQGCFASQECGRRREAEVHTGIWISQARIERREREGYALGKSAQPVQIIFSIPVYHYYFVHALGEFAYLVALFACRTLAEESRDPEGHSQLVSLDMTSQILLTESSNSLLKVIPFPGFFTHGTLLTMSHLKQMN